MSRTNTLRIGLYAGIGRVFKRTPRAKYYYVQSFRRNQRLIDIGLPKQYYTADPYERYESGTRH
ncbi:hypothetical protein SAMN05421809_3310 [Natronorubrum daqingense]|uniref:Uncharacterized protein n=1 Tax=Natronorubrum daqingense TaxID=588898 RepID=A0A1N7FKH1_9EURY|nr:hypothetical protein SAMN05421809_3310 [Natronorubrum daqingense]